MIQELRVIRRDIKTKITFSMSYIAALEIVSKKVRKYPRELFQLANKMPYTVKKTADYETIFTQEYRQSWRTLI